MNLSRKQLVAVIGGGTAVLAVAAGLLAIGLATMLSAEAETMSNRLAAAPRPSATATAVPTSSPSAEPVVIDVPPVEPIAPPVEEPVYEKPAPVDDGVPDGAWPLTWIDDPNSSDGGYWDMSGCATSASTINGQPYCIP